MSPVPALKAEPAIPSRRSILLAAGTVALATAGLAKTACADMLGDLGSTPLTAATFLPLVGSYFIVTDGDARPQLKLVNVVVHDRGTRPTGLPDPFSLIFSTPFADDLATQMYEVENQGIGRISMFITPVAQNVYEAPFN